MVHFPYLPILVSFGLYKVGKLSVGVTKKVIHGASDMTHTLGDAFAGAANMLVSKSKPVLADASASLQKGLGIVSDMVNSSDSMIGFTKGEWKSFKEYAKPFTDLIPKDIKAEADKLVSAIKTLANSSVNTIIPLHSNSKGHGKL